MEREETETEASILFIQKHAQQQHPERYLVERIPHVSHQHAHTPVRSV